MCKPLKILLAVSTLMVICFHAFPNGKKFNVVDFGALPNRNINSREAIEKAIDACFKNGGGIVFFPKGEFISSTIHLKSNVILYLDKGAILSGIKEPLFDYPEYNEWDKYQDFGHSHYKSALIYGRDLKNIGIEGPGKIEGRGFTTSNEVIPGNANRGISLVKCTGIVLKDFSISDCGHFGIIVNGCENIVADHIIVDEYDSRDAFNIIGSKNIRITHSLIRGSDDGIVLKSDYSLGEDLSVENIFVRDCIITSKTCNAFQIGSETVGNFKNITVENCNIIEAGKAGIGITSNDGGNIDSLVFRDIKMEKISTPFFINVTSRLSAPGNRTTGKIKNIFFINIEAKEVDNQYTLTDQRWYTSTINGTPESQVEDVIFKNVDINYKGGGKAEDCNSIVPELGSSASSPRHLKIRPAYGWYIRHAKNISFYNCRLSLAKKDMRPAFFADDVIGLTLDKIEFPHFKDVPVIILKNSTDIKCQRIKGLKDSIQGNEGIKKFYINGGYDPDIK
jgi:polygalacturonase